MKNLLIIDYYHMHREGNKKLSSFWALKEQARESTCSQPYSEFQQLHKTAKLDK